MENQVQLKTACIDDMDVYAFREAGTDRLRITGVAIEGQLSVPTLSFWRSMFGEVGLSSQVGPRFDEYEWFLRLRSAHPYLVFRYAIVTDRHGNSLLLGKPRDAAVALAEFEDALESVAIEITQGEPLQPELDDYASERLTYQWQGAGQGTGQGTGHGTGQSANGSLMSAPKGGVRPSVN